MSPFHPLRQLNGCFKHPLVKRVQDHTKRRLIAAASELFAERGFRATTAREIAERAGVNLAAANYHYGSKKELYLEVLRAQFSEIRALLERRGGTRPPAEIARMPREEVVELLRTRMKLILDNLIGPPPGIHGALMQREMADPSQALPVIVKEFIRPMSEEMGRIVARLVPGLSRRELLRCVISVMSQAVFYRFAMPAVLRMHGLSSYPPGFGDELADQITNFSIGGIERIGAQRGRKRSG